MSARTLIALVLLTAVGTARADDPTTTTQLQETVARLEKKIADLEARVAALEKQAKAEPGKGDDEYLKTQAGAVLDSLMAGDSPGLKNKFTKNMELGIDSFWKEGLNHDNEVIKWVENWNKTAKFKTHAIEKVVVSPDKAEAVVTGTLIGKEPADKATFTLTLVKDKANANKYLVDAIAVRAK
jgi:hypothetical protein